VHILLTPYLLHEITRIQLVINQIPAYATHTNIIYKLLSEDKANLDELNNIATQFLTTKHFTFYTDDSLTHLQSPQCRMGFGWIETSTATTFKGATIFNPSSTKSETIAILTTLIAIPDESTVNIYTDSQNCIHN
jgi:hypothetical protein